MKLEEIWFVSGQKIKISGAGINPEGEFFQDEKKLEQIPQVIFFSQVENSNFSMSILHSSLGRYATTLLFKNPHRPPIGNHSEIQRRLRFSLPPKN
jgi:hypothetical protein